MTCKVLTELMVYNALCIEVIFIRKTLTISLLTDFINMINGDFGVVTETGPNFERSTKVKRSVCDTVSCSGELFRGKKLWTRQSVLDSFLKERADIYVKNYTQQGPYFST
jgi:hypothetical protein